MDDYTGAPPKGWPRFPNDVIAQSISDYAAIVSAIRDALQPRFVEFVDELGHRMVTITPCPGMTIAPFNSQVHPDCTVITMPYGSVSGEMQIIVRCPYIEAVAKLRGAQ